jgi:hypothetical protein
MPWIHDWVNELAQRAALGLVVLAILTFLACYLCRLVK